MRGELDPLLLIGSFDAFILVRLTLRFTVPPSSLLRFLCRPDHRA